MVSPLKFKLSSLKPKPSSLGRTNFIPSIAKGRTVITSEVNTYTVELHPTPVPHHLHLFFVATMARLFSRTILKGIVSHSHAMPMKVVGASSFSRYERKWFATVPEDPDSHEDFKPTKKVIDSSSLKDMIEKDVKENPVMIYMKGVPESPGCGFSALAVKVILQYDVPFSARNILEDANLKKSVKAFSNWPTFPQIFINGEFVGGSDIILNMHQSGELKEMLKQFKAQSD